LSRKTVWLLCGGIAVVAAAGAWILWPRATLGDQAAKFAELLMDGDTDALWEHSIEKYRGDSGLSKLTFRQMYEKLFAPRMIGWRVTGPFVSQSGDARGLAQAPMEHTSGAVSAIGWAVFNDGDGNGLVLVTGLLAKAWIMESLAAGGKADAPNFKFDAIRAGLLKDLETLRMLGLKGKIPADPTQPVMTLDEWVASHKREAERIAAARGE
jgi:hypothetical protein